MPPGTRVPRVVGREQGIRLFEIINKTIFSEPKRSSSHGKLGHNNGLIPTEQEDQTLRLTNIGYSYLNERTHHGPYIMACEHAESGAFIRA